MEWNKTTKLLIPCVLVTPENKEFPLSELQKTGFLNAYIDDFGLKHSSFDWYDEGGYFLYLLFKPKTLKIFSSEEEIYKRFSNWVDYYDLEDGKVMHVFEIKEIYHKDIDKFRIDFLYLHLQSRN